MESFPAELLVIASVAALAPLLAELPKGFRLPVVVIEILLGILIGPHLLNLAAPDGMIGVLGGLGLTFLLFMVGLEIDVGDIAGRPMSLAVGGWFLSFLAAMLLAFLFSTIGLIDAPPLWWRWPCPPPPWASSCRSSGTTESLAPDSANISWPPGPWASSVPWSPSRCCCFPPTARWSTRC
jgi:hypothetical protein